MRILYMGTPEFAVPSLKRLYDDGHEICGVYTQPDKPKNRGMKMSFSAVKELALRLGLDIYQPVRLREEAVIEEIRALAPELICVVAYGKILPKAILDIPQYGCINIHGSVLPRYRGSAPIQWSVINGEAEAGVTAMYLAEEMDSGDVIEAVSTPVLEYETSGELTLRLMELGAELIGRTVSAIEDGSVTSAPQDHAAATYAPPLTKELSPVDWTRPAREILSQIHGLNPWPVASAVIKGRELKLYNAVYGDKTEKTPGTVLSAGKRGLEIACGDGMSVVVTVLQAAGKKKMNAADYLRGNPIEAD